LLNPAREILPCAFTRRDTPAGRLAGRVTAAAICGAGVARVFSAAIERSASRNRSIGGRPPQDWCGRSVLYSLTHSSSAACSSPMDANNRSLPVKNSRRMVLSSRSILPVVVG
jgi:hypothetical protein